MYFRFCPPLGIQAGHTTGLPGYSMDIEGAAVKNPVAALHDHLFFPAIFPLYIRRSHRSVLTQHTEYQRTDADYYSDRNSYHVFQDSTQVCALSG